MFYFEFNTVSLIEECPHGDGSSVNKDVLSIFALDKSISFSSVVPFYDSFQFLSTPQTPESELL